MTFPGRSVDVVYSIAFLCATPSRTKFWWHIACRMHALGVAQVHNSHATRAVVAQTNSPAAQPSPTIFMRGEWPTLVLNSNTWYAQKWNFALVQSARSSLLPTSMANKLRDTWSPDATNTSIKYKTLHSNSLKSLNPQTPNYLKIQMICQAYPIPI